MNHEITSTVSLAHVTRFRCFECMFSSVSCVNAHVWINYAYAHEMQVQKCMLNTRVLQTPSCSCGREEVSSGGEAENQTALAKLQWKKRWQSFSIMLQIEQCLSILFYRFPARSQVASALLINLQTNALMQGERVLCFQVLDKICKAE
jgi:hypothetical protein